MLLIPTVDSASATITVCYFQLDKLTIMDLFRKDSDSSRPNSYSQKRENHLRHDTAVHPHHDGPLGVLLHVAGTMLVRSMLVGFFDSLATLR